MRRATPKRGVSGGLLVSVLLHAALLSVLVVMGLMLRRPMPEAPDVPAQIDVLLGDNAPQKGTGPTAETAPDAAPVPPPAAPMPSAPGAADAPATTEPAPRTAPPEVNLDGGTMGATSIDDDRVHGAVADTANLPPHYPPGAGEAFEHGLVRLRMTIDDLGLVTRVDVLVSSGYPRLDRAAQNTLRTWRFTPATRGGKPVSDSLELEVNFTLK